MEQIKHGIDAISIPPRKAKKFAHDGLYPSPHVAEFMKKAMKSAKTGVEILNIPKYGDFLSVFI
jgi:hypothetical protein